MAIFGGAEMIWGYALVWASHFLKDDPDPLFAKLSFLRRHKLRITHAGLDEIDRLTDVQRERLFGELKEHDLMLMPSLGPKWQDADADSMRRRLDEQLSRIEKYHRQLRCPMVHLGGQGTHRFDRENPLARQMTLLAERLPHAVERCRDLGLAIGIENHGDYYVSDLVELCRRVPGLGIFLDTGNCYLVGEKPLPAAIESAPFLVGGHFKDHRVRPVQGDKSLHFELSACVTGEGDVPLREIYSVIAQASEDRAKLGGDRSSTSSDFCMLIELIPPSFSGNDPIEAAEKSVAFVRSLAR